MKKLNLPRYDWSLVRLLNQSAHYPLPDLWRRTNGIYRQFKDDVTDKMLKEQSHPCAYCGSRLFEKNPHRDHIAPQQIYPEWTFWPRNIVLACYACNTDRKKNYDSVDFKGKSYKTTTFNIVHPFIDEPSHHIKFVGYRGKVLVCSAKSTLKGRATINLFDLGNTERAKQRAKDALMDSDVAHLHGKWRLLMEQVIFSPFPKEMILGS